MSKALEDIAAERQRQVSDEGWTPEHDDGHRAGDLSLAASAYSTHAAALLGIIRWGSQLPANYQTSSPPSYWPWERGWWKPKDPRRDLVRAGALIVAEIERLDRADNANKS